MATNILFIDIESRSPAELNFLENLNKLQSNDATFAQNLIFYDTESQEQEAKEIKLNVTFKIKGSHCYIYSLRGGNEEYFKKLIEIFRKKFRANKNINYHRIIIDIPEFTSETIILRPNGLEEIVSIEDAVERKLALLETISQEFS